MLRRIPLAQIERNHEQPRQHFDETALRELASSIRQNGLQQPIVVRPLGKGRFEVVMGERRFRAHQMIDAPDILCHVRRMDDQTRDISAIIENLNRVDISPIETARAYQRMLDNGMSAEELAKRLGLHQAWRITEKVQLLALRPEYQQILGVGQMTSTQAFYLSKLAPRDQDRIFRSLDRLRSTAQLAGAVEAILAEHAQSGMFSDAESGKLDPEEEEALTALERRIDAIAKMVSGGFDQDNRITIAKKIRPDRAEIMAEKLRLIQCAISPLVSALQRSTGAGAISRAA